MKKLVALLLCAVMVLSLAACGKKPTATAVPASPTPAADPTKTPDPTAAPVEKVIAYTTDYKTNTTIGGKFTTNLASKEGAEVSYNVYKGKEGQDYTDPKFYTMNDYISGTSNMKWSTHTWETNEDSYVLDYISSGFYTFKLNEALDGWAVTCELAAELPKDVTSEYVGKYGLTADSKAQAWEIKLLDTLCWENGEKINADTFIYSYKELLDPVMKNRRADSLYAGDFQIVGAKNYFYQGQTAASAIGTTAAEYIAAGGKAEDLYVDCWNFWGAKGYVDANGNEAPQYVLITDETVYDVPVEGGDAFSGKELYETYFQAGAAYESYGGTYLATVSSYEANYSWDNVGIIKKDENTIVMIVTAPVADPAYYVPYHLSSSYLVYEPLWESCKQYFNSEGVEVTKDSADIVSISTNYGTSVDTTISYGPYKLTYFELDKQITMERNEKWFGYSDGRHLGQYQTDKISCTVIGEQATALLSFLNGEIDNVSLVSADMAKYGSSSYIRYTPQSYTTKLTFNTDLDKTTGRGTNSQVMTNVWFRKGFALAIDRAQFASAYTAAGSAGFGMLNYMYVYDPFTGATYRDTDGAKKAIVDLYGLTYGEDGDYDDLDAAYEAVTGYDLKVAQECMAKAYEELVADKVYDGTSNITLEIRVYSSDDTYVQMFNYLNDTLKEACKGTKFEGKVSMTMVADADYYDTNYAGGADMIFTTWGGAAYTPFTTLYECYCDAEDKDDCQQMEYGFKTSTKMVVAEIDGKTFTKSLHDWALWMDADPNLKMTSDDGTYTLEAFADYDAQTKANLFGLMEYTYLSYFVTTPIYYRNSATLVSQKGDYAVTKYVDLVGFGGTDFYTYKYDDAAWADAVKAGLSY